jgi:hypothetical protein
MPASSRPPGLCCLWLLLLLLVPGCHKPDPKAAAALFFQQLFGGQTSEAYDSTAFGFQAFVSKRSFDAVAHERGFVGASVVNLGAPQIEGQTAKLEAEAHSATGEKLNFVVTMTHENGLWRLYSLRFPRSLQNGFSENPFDVVNTIRPGSFKEPSEFPIPDDKAVRRLVRDALLEFNRAIRARSFSDFYAYVASAWQAQLTEKQLQSAFQQFIDNEVDISAIADSEPQFDAPVKTTSDGILTVTGHYPTRPVQILFTLKFVHEATVWKLFGIDVKSDTALKADKGAGETTGAAR